MDAAALVEAGIGTDQVLAAQGAVERKDAEDRLRGYSYVAESLSAGLNRARRIVWCGDDDGPGLALRADMARIFGAAKFWFVTWPEGSKDANDLLRTDGGAALRELVTQGALPWPADGLYRLSELPEAAPLPLWEPGFPEWESKVKLAPRTLSVVTGHPGHGKTQLFGQIWFNVLRRYDLVAAIASFETRPKPHIRRQLRTLFTGRLERDLSEEEKQRADEWIEDHYLFLAHSAHQPTLEWLLETSEVAIIRHGARIIQVDPWNRLEDSAGPNETETKYVLRCLREIYAFAGDLNCHFQIVVHPSKMHDHRRGTAPLLEDISGSKHWENIVDQGFAVHRPVVFDGATGTRKTEAVLYHRKARFEELGYPCELKLNFDLGTRRYVSTDYS
jgi:twinkle protein